MKGENPMELAQLLKGARVVGAAVLLLAVIWTVIVVFFLAG
jgi:hypothetical protein